MRAKSKIAKLLVVITLLFSISITNIGLVFAETQLNQPENNQNDTLLIPDQYNTGCNESLCKPWSTDNDAFIKAGGVYRNNTAGSILTIDFNKAASFKNLKTDTIVYENIDFTAFPCFEFMNSQSTAGLNNCTNGYSKLNFKFINCIVPSVWGHNTNDSICNYTIEMQNCTLYRFTGQYATFNKCRFGGASYWKEHHNTIFDAFRTANTFGDPLNPQSNCSFTNCYVYDAMFSTDIQGSAHIDGIQTQEIHDFSMINCRFELPQMNFSASQGGYNAAIFLQGIITNGTFKNIIVNGATKAIQSISDVHVNTNFQNVKYGLDSQLVNLTKQYDPSSNNYVGPICDGTNDISEQNLLYVTSTIKDKDKIKIVTTNDTGADRKLKVVTNVGQEIYTIPSIKNGEELELDATWEETNVDYIVSLNATDVTSVRCFDVTDEENEVEVCYSEQFVEMNISDESDDNATYSLGGRDKLVIPDKYNTGLSDKSLCIETLSEPNSANRRFAGRNTDLAFKNSSVTSCHGETTVTLSVVVNEKDEYIIENVDFETYDILFSTSVSGTVIFRNCKLNKVSTGSNNKVIFENCDIQGMLRGGNIEVRGCKIHNTTGDALFPIANADTQYAFKVSDTYIYDLCNDNTATGEHIDGIQITGAGEVDSTDLLPKIEMNNVRFSLPMFQQYVDDDTDTGKVNACIFVQGLRGKLAEGNLFNNIIIDSSNITNPIFVSGGTDANSSIFNNVKISNQWASPFRNSENIYYTTNNCTLNNSLYVSSVYEKNGKYNIVVTNNNNTNKTLKVKTNKGTEEFDIGLSPTTNELMNDSTYSSYSFENMTYDKIVEIDSTDVEYIVCYDGDEQIRFVDFTEDKKHTASNEDTPEESETTNRDIVIIPDIYNTGVNNINIEYKDLIQPTENFVLKGTNGTNWTIQLKDDIWLFNVGPIVGGNDEFIVENYDLSNYPFKITQINKMTSGKITLKFKNCKLNRQVGTIEGNEYFEFIFEDCTLSNVEGKGTPWTSSYSSYTRCLFTEMQMDTFHPGVEFTLKDCYIYNPATTLVDGLHIDGMQAFGATGKFVENVVIDNTRIEMDDTALFTGTAYLNSPLMFSTRYGYGYKNVHLSNLILSGGNSLYCDISQSLEEGIDASVENFTWENISYPNHSAKYLWYGQDYTSAINVTDENQNIFVSSIWKENGKIKICYTNDSDQGNRKLKVVTNKGEEIIDVPALNTGEIYHSVVQNIDESNYTIKPVDLIYETNADGIEYIKCYDITEDTPIEIRSISNTKELITRGDIKLSQNGFKFTIISTEDGTHKVSVKAENPTALTGNVTIPSMVIIDDVEYIVTSIENEAFKGSSITGVIFPETITSIGADAFNGCDSLKTIEFQGKTAPTMDANALNGISSTVKISVPSNSTGYDEQITSEDIHVYEASIVAPTCTKEGYTLHQCIKCDDSYKDNYVNALGHQHTEVRNAVAATCTTEGYTGDVYCTDCDSVVTHGQTISKTAHTYVYGICQFCEAVKESSQEGLKYTVIVTEDGTHKVSVKADENANLSENIVIPSTIVIDGETYTVTEIEDNAFKGTDIKSIVISDSIEKIGSNAFENCENLNYIEFKGTTAPIFESDSLNGITENITLVVPDDAQGYNNQIITSKVEHIYKTQIYNPDCTHRGYTKYSCILCSDEKASDYVDALGHSYNNGIITKAATCKDYGIMTYKCTRCDNTYEETIAKDSSNHGNNTEVRNKKEASCTEEGYTGDIYCKDCNTKLSSGMNIPKSSHNYTTTVKEATCTESGYTTYTCKTCGYSYNDNQSPAKGHTAGLVSQENMSGPASFTNNMTCDNVTRCSTCSIELNRETIVIATKIASVSIPRTIYSYTGKEIKPVVTVKDTNGNIISSENYTATYKNNKKIGKGTVIVTFKNNYTGSKTITFYIGPKMPSFSSIKATANTLNLTWKTQLTNTTGYEIQYSTSKDFKKNPKIINVTKNKIKATTIKKLKSKKTYYLRIRSYKKIGKKKYYSEWSKIKKVKTK